MCECAAVNHKWEYFITFYALASEFVKKKMVYLFCRVMLSVLFFGGCVRANFFIFIRPRESFADVWMIIIGFVGAHRKTPAVVLTSRGFGGVRSQVKIFTFFP